MSGYVLEKKGLFVSVDECNIIRKTPDASRATVYSTQKKAMRQRDRATNKLKGFKIRPAYLFCDENEKLILDTDKHDILDTSQEAEKDSFSSSKRRRVYAKNEGHCAICGKFVGPDEFTVDHIIPLAKGGSNDFSNLQCTCRECNAIKQDILLDELMDKLITIVKYQLKKKENKKYRKVFAKFCK